MPATADITFTMNRPDVWRPFTYPYVITLSDVIADANLLRDGVPYRWIQNRGTGGLIKIRWANGTDVSIYLAQGAEHEGGLFVHAYTTGTVGGADLIGLVGMPGGPG